MTATLPRATVTVQPSAILPGDGADLICVWSPCAQSADLTPRLFGTADAVYAQHGYCEGVEYAAMHITQTGKAVLFVGMPIGTAGVLSRLDPAGNTGTCVVSVTAGGDGVLAEHDGVLRVAQGGTIGTDQIKLDLSLDGGRTFQSLRLGTGSSIALPLINVTASFAAGTLITGDVALAWHGSAPLPTSGDFATARAALAAQLQLFRSVLVCGDVPDSTTATAIATQMNAYNTSNDRFVYARASISDRTPLGAMSHIVARMTGTPALTFAEVGASGDTITRSEGSWLADGARDGDTVVVIGSASNNITGVVASVTDLVLTMGTTDLAAETTSAATVVFYPTLTFAEVGASGDTITRNRGSWLDDGIFGGSTISILGTASNNVTGAVASATATVLTMGTTDLAAEVIATNGVTVTTGQTKAAWMAAQDAAFATVDAQPRLVLSAGRGPSLSPYSGWLRRVPANWQASVREYQHDLHVPTWRKADGPLDGVDLFDSAGNLIEWDERIDGPAGVAGRFTTLRTYSNRTKGAFVALDQTRAGDGQITSLTNNMAVLNEACTVVQSATEQLIGESLTLNANGTATKDSLATLAAGVNAALQLELLSAGPEGPRASQVVWAPDPSDVYNVPTPTTHGSLTLELNGVVFDVDTAVRVLTNGQQ